MVGTGAGVIRKLRDSDVPAVMHIWLASNLEAHSFIPASYWTGSSEAVSHALPQAEVYVCESGETRQVIGFVGLSGEYVEGLFVRADMRGRGVGRQLLDYAKSLRQALRLHVYLKNRRALAFYRREGFAAEAESTDEATGERELLMAWRAPDAQPR